MDNEVERFEAELKRLRPIAPSRAIEQTIARELARQPRRRFAPVQWLGMIAVPFAAAIAVVAFWLRGRESVRTSPSWEPPPATESVAAFRPVAAENILYAARDEGLVFLSDGTPARRARLSYVDTFTWRDARTNASLTWTVPREEVRVIPVNVQ